MKIRVKIILVVLPVVISMLSIAQAASYFSAQSGITQIAQSFFNYKALELEKYAEGQWSLLSENNFAARPDMVEAARQSVILYAQSIILSDTEVILAINNEGMVEMQASGTGEELELSAAEAARLLIILREENQGIARAVMGGEERVLRAFHFTPFGWYIVLTESVSTFYHYADRIRSQTILILISASLLSMLILVLFARRLTNPLGRVVEAMNAITKGGDLSSKVEVEYSDETGNLASTFNLMTGELERAYSQIKRYAFEAVLAGKKELRIRQIFQKYVPKELIDRFFASPESMLVGENRELAVLFSDIRSFTTISENMAPDDLVNSLNRYFSGQVDIIMNRNGIVDKYIGDAIMAFWGAPVNHKDDALQSVIAGLEMIESVKKFNEQQVKLNKPEFHLGIGINYGTVTVGNIGSERKMDYTVIGDMVNLASRMEGLTKVYKVELLISETIYEELNKMEEKPRGISYRLLDIVAVVGKTKGVKIYTAKKGLAENEEKAWAYHNRGMALYHNRNFTEAAKYFTAVINLLPGDYNALDLLERCKKYTASPPPPDWNGIEVMQSK